MAPPRHTRVDRAVDRDAIPGQWAARDDKVLKASTRRRLRRSLRGHGGRSLRYRDVVGRRIRHVRGASESENHRCGNTKFFQHVASKNRKQGIAVRQAVRAIAPSYRPNTTITTPVAYYSSR